MKGKWLFICSCVLLQAFCFFLLLSTAIAQSEDLTITTYYPSPKGTYSELRLSPHISSTSCDSSTIGTLYYDSNPPGGLTICTSSGWQQLGIPSGAVMSFNLRSCPAGWSELTSARGRYIVGAQGGASVGATVGTKLTDRESQPVGKHYHAYEKTIIGHNQAPGSGFQEGGGRGRVDYVNTCISETGSSCLGGSVTGPAPDGTNAPYIQLLMCQKD
ncbi:MAG: hypothetical protein PHT41_07900 [Candidatus Omnitrophica bacterium]|nr:hypothetical protein [Candidatus Omnitrophota bacterium]